MRQVQKGKETSERKIDEAFDILFAEVIKRMQELQIGGETVYG